MPTKTSYNPLEWPSIANMLILSNSGNLGTSTIVGPILWYTSDSRTDSGSVSDWKGKLKRGEQATSELQGVRYRYSRCQHFATISLEKQSKTGFDDYGELVWFGALGVNSGAAVPSNADASGLSKAQATAASVFTRRALAEQRALQGAVSAGELAQTLRMIRRPMQSLRRGVDEYLNAVKKRASGNKSRKKKRDIIADTWLEYNLGWRPFINDLNGARDALGRTMTEDTRRHVYGSGTARNLQHFEDHWEPGTVTTFDRSWDVLDICSVRYVGQVRVQGGNPGLKQLLGVSGRDVLPTIWELIPYSFIADYFVNIGAVVDALSLQFSDGLIWCEKRQKISRTTVFSPPKVKGRNSGTWKVVGVTSSGSPASITRDDVYRGAQGGFPIPDFQFRIPGVKEVSKWLNIGALLASSKRASYAIQG